MSEPLELLCVCDDEWCYCTNLVTVQLAEPYPATAPEVPCPECKAGHHVAAPGGPRS